MPHYDYLIIGSGLYGATFAHKAKQAGKKVLVIDKRPHIGGNVYCENIEGINVHKYGAHIFHTSNKKVWDFVNSIVEFNRYTNCPMASYKGELYNLPFNMNTFNRMWPEVHTPAEAQAKIDEQKAEAEAVLGGRDPQNLEEQALCLVGKDIFYKLIKEYTEKQWGRDCKDLPAFIIKRLPVRMIFDNNYFNDRYQGIPIGGYNKLIEGLLEGVDCKTGVDFFKSEYKEWKKYADKLVYTGAVDEYFDYNLVVAHGNGRPCDCKIIEKGFNRLKEEAGLPNVVFHSLRHSSTTYKLKLNHGDIKATQGDTGHAQADMVTKVYAHILDEDRKVNAQKFESAFYANPDLRDVKPPAEQKTAIDLGVLIEQLKQSPELTQALAGLIVG